MKNGNTIRYDHLKDYPVSTEGYSEIGNRSVAAALCCEHMPDAPEASPGHTPPDRRRTNPR